MDRKLDVIAETARAIEREHKLTLVDLRTAFIEYWKKNNPKNKTWGFPDLRRKPRDLGRPPTRRGPDAEEVQVGVRGRSEGR
jgi:hypothetical protein